ncbi:MAG: hypothetical protein PHI49_10845 [Halothiobacillaceae bacterium]|jgi:hypothetical protein|nr:hypothetical protein [Halothiobacillaceae bacterium]MDY0050637.1 hypothetical protein [Halothiobacillaceae bacterium]
MGAFGAIWGVGGVSLLLAWAIVRLSERAWEGWQYDFGWMHWVLFAGWMVFMVYGEGYRGFQKAFSPRVVARAAYLRANPNPLHVLLAPLFCMGFIHATRKRRIVSFSVTGGVVLLVLLVSLLPQPWRGIIDAGVVAGLSYGLLAIGAFALSALLGRPPTHPHDAPESESGASVNAG